MMFQRYEGFKIYMYFNRVKNIGNFQLRFTKKANSSRKYQHLRANIWYAVPTSDPTKTLCGVFGNYEKNSIFCRKTAIFARFWPFFNFEAP